jgi:hypothetical protein
MRLEPIFDVLHYFVLEGPRIAKEDVMSYLHRATGCRASTLRSKGRAYERLKQRLRLLGVELRTDVDADGTRFLVIPGAAAAKARLETHFERLNPGDVRAY